MKKYKNKIGAAKDDDAIDISNRKTRMELGKKL